MSKDALGRDPGVFWCEHCQDNFDEDHYDADDRHKVGVGPYGRLVAERDRYKAALERISAHPDAYPHPYDPGDLAVIAREALAEKPQQAT